MPKIAIIEPVGGHGGMHYYDFGLARGLVAAGQDVVVYTCTETAVPDGLPFRVVKRFTGVWGQTPKPLRALRFVRALVGSLLDARSHGVDIVHFHFFHYTVLETLCMRLSRAFGFRVVVTVHDVESFAGRTDVGRVAGILSLADRIIVHNRVSRQELCSTVSVAEKKIAVIPHGNYLDMVRLPDKAHARQALGLAADNRIILFFGQIKKVKGLDVLLNALSNVIRTHPDVRLLIAGKVWKDDYSAYQKIIDEQGFAAHVTSRIRYIADEEVADYYRAADIVVLPYRKIYQSGVLLMAMSFEVPVLVSDLPGMTEIITDGDNGFVFESGNAASLSTRLNDALSHPDKLAAIGAAGYQTAVQEHGWDRIGALTANVYRACLNE